MDHKIYRWRDFSLQYYEFCRIPKVDSKEKALNLPVNLNFYSHLCSQTVGCESGPITDTGGGNEKPWPDG